ncbi:hypothetical protein P3378_23055 [Vibrio parahaemolyticus]|nr:hypothetical protein [Vibrio parahaemolyticus]
MLCGVFGVEVPCGNLVE